MSKASSALHKQFDRLKEKITWRAAQLDIDLSDISVIEFMLEISNGETDADGNPNESWEESTWLERIFSMAFRCSTEGDFDDVEEEDLIDSLCLGNWAIGFVDGLPGDGSDSECISCQVERMLSERAKRGALEKLKRDPKQAAKAQVNECWIAWRKKPETYKGKSAFAKDMMEKYEKLDSQVVITRWCSQWEKEASD